MKEKSLYVKLPAGLKEKLLKRFDLRRARLPKTGFWIIRVSCAVCAAYEDCDDCPFGRWGRYGCAFWLKQTSRWQAMKDVLLYRVCVCWPDSHNSSARDLIRSIRRAIKKYIITTPEEG